MTSLEHPELPAHVLEEPIEWIQPTSTPYVFAELVQVVEVTSSEEEDPEKDPAEDPEEELEVQQPEPDVDMLPMPEEDVEPVIELDPVEEVAPEPAAESVEESGLGWLIESDESASHDYRLEWMAPAYASRYPRSSTIPTTLPVVEVISSRSSLEFAIVLDIDRPNPSCAARVVIPSDSSSVGDPDNPDSLSSQMD